MQLEGRVAIVTGGAVRLGRAMALALARQGAHIALHFSSSEGQAGKTLEEINEAGSKAVAVQADFRDPVPAARTVIQSTVAEFAAPHILVNNAAIFEAGTLAETSEAMWNRHVAINLKAPFFLAQAFAEQLQAGQEAHIVNIADWRPFRGETDHLAYTVAKGGLITLTKSLARDLAPQVQVNAIAPGAILPPPGEDASYMQRIAEEIPLRRTGSPEEITETLLWMLRSHFLTGTVVPVAGGEDL